MRMRSLAVTVVVTGLTVAGAACGGGGDPGPMSGQQVLAGRDVGELFFWKQRTLAFTRQTQDPSQPEPQDLWIWRLDEPEAEIALAGVDWAFPRSWPRWFVGDLLLTAGRSLVLEIPTVGAAEDRAIIVGPVGQRRFVPEVSKQIIV